ncbi:MAG: DNA-binding protein WhiA [Clostridiales bacterium]|nr:DNA-binding protein WhiA [Clostridiales bacterium]
MSFTQNIKAQLARQENGCGFCDIAELSSVVKLCTGYTAREIVISTENEDVAYRIQYLFERVFSRRIEYINRNGIFRFYPGADFFMKEMAPKLMLYNSGKSNITPRPCCRAAYVRGAFLGGGSVSDPKVRYHMEFDTRHESYANQLCGVLAKMGIGSKITRRKGRFIVYIKEYEVIADILGTIGAVSAAMELYNISIEKDIRNTANRQANCEVANIEKTTKTASLQIEAIRKIERHMALSELPETLSEIAEVRLKYPEESLKELGERLSPPLGKSGVNHRLKRIMKIAEGL